MIVFLYGPDTFRAKEKIKEIISHYKTKHRTGLNLRFFDFLADDFSLQELEHSARQETMFREKKLYIISNPFAQKQALKNKISGLLSSGDVFLLFEEALPDKKDELFQILKEKASCQEFNFLTGLKVKKWIKEKIEQQNKAISEKALAVLSEYVKSDLWLAGNEISKLINFVQEKEIQEKDVRIFIKPDLKIEIFKTIDAIAEKNKERAIDLLRAHLKSGDSPLYLLSMISYQFKNVLIVKDLAEKKLAYREMLKASGLQSFIFKKSYDQSLKFDFSGLKKIYQKLLETDLNIKTGRIEPETALDLLIAEI